MKLVTRVDVKHVVGDLCSGIRFSAVASQPEELGLKSTDQPPTGNLSGVYQASLLVTKYKTPQTTEPMNNSAAIFASFICVSR